ncbi:MAG: hypothetical protein V9E99_11235 [Microthrixaceae bacterium]
MRPRSVAVAVAALVALAGAPGCAEPVVHAERSASWDPRIAKYAEFLEAEYGVKWKAPVAVRFLTDTAFDRLSQFGRSADHSGSTWQDEALGFAATSLDTVLGPDEDGTELLGFYQATSRSLVVRGTTIDSRNEFVVVHELAHAMQQQNFSSLDEPFGDPDRELATLAVLEGDANSAAAHWMVAHPPSGPSPDGGAEEPAGEAEQAAFANFRGTGVLGWWQTLMPYTTGWRFVETAVAAGGKDARARLLDLAGHRRLTTLDILMLRTETLGTDAPPLTGARSEREWRRTGPIGGLRWFALLVGLGADPRTVLQSVDTETATESADCYDAAFAGPPGMVDRINAALGGWFTNAGTALAGDGTGRAGTAHWCRSSVPEALVTIDQASAIMSADNDAAAALVRPSP